MHKQNRHHRIPCAAGQNEQRRQAENICAELNHEMPGAATGPSAEPDPGTGVERRESGDDGGEEREHRWFQDLELEGWRDREHLRGNRDPTQANDPCELRCALLGVGGDRWVEEGSKGLEHLASVDENSRPGKGLCAGRCPRLLRPANRMAAVAQDLPSERRQNGEPAGIPGPAEGLSR